MTGPAPGRSGEPTSGTTLPGDLAAALAGLASDRARRPLLLALDFDGTLAPLQDDPSRSAILPDGVAQLRRLADRRDAGIHLALVSGRALADLARLADVPVGTTFIGSHGAERARLTGDGLDRATVRLSPQQVGLLRALARTAAQVADAHPGVWVESKPAAVVVHTRRADPGVAAAAEAEALRLGPRLGARVLHGKRVVELSVLDADKGRALTDLRGVLGARDVLYAGDDATDEDAFVALAPTDLTVKVGPGPTAARYRVNGPDQVVEVLRVLADRTAPGR